MMSQERLESSKYSYGRAYQRKTSREQKTILLVGMTPIIEELVVNILMLAHYQIKTVDMRQIATHDWIDHVHLARVDGILLDVDIYTRATVRNPQDFLQAFSERWNIHSVMPDRPPLILLTTQAQRREELQQGAFVDAVVIKPFKPQFLLDMIKMTMEQRRKRQVAEQEVVHAGLQLRG